MMFICSAPDAYPPNGQQGQAAPAPPPRAPTHTMATRGWPRRPDPAPHHQMDSRRASKSGRPRRGPPRQRPSWGRGGGGGQLQQPGCPPAGLAGEGAVSRRFQWGRIQDTRGGSSFGAHCTPTLHPTVAAASADNPTPAPRLGHASPHPRHHQPLKHEPQCQESRPPNSPPSTHAFL